MSDKTTEDLTAWGYAPGWYVIRCMDCPKDLPFPDMPMADKRAWRCETHARKARDEAEWQAAQPPLVCDIEVPHA